MITEVRVRNEAGATLALPMYAFSENSDYIIAGIDGLGPVASAIATSPYAILPGSQVLSSRGEDRSIIMTLGFSPYATRSTQVMRQDLYEFFMTNSSVYLEFHSDEMRTVYIEGRVETHEPDIFSPTPANKVSIFCSKPDFLDLETITIEGMTADEILIDYPGTVPCGFITEVYLDVATPSVRVDVVEPITSMFGVTDPRWTEPPSNDPMFRSGDRVILTTVPGRKNVVRERGGVTNSVLAYKDASSQWLTLRKGTNELQIITGTPWASYKISYQPRYGGL